MDSIAKKMEERCFFSEKHTFRTSDKTAEIPDLVSMELERALPGAKRQRTQEPDSCTSGPRAVENPKSEVDDSSPLDTIPDDVLSLILTHTAAVTCSPGDFINLLLASRRICQLGQQPQVLRYLPLRALQVAAADWCPSALKFLSRCCQSGNRYASYALGMIAFYCLGRPGWGSRLLAESAVAKCPEALYSLAVIHFNGSGASKEHRDVPTGVALCMQAASLGHSDAMRELGHCFQDGYGVPRDSVQGRQLLMRANMQDAASALKAGACRHNHQHTCSNHQSSHGCADAQPEPSQPSPENSGMFQDQALFPPGQLVTRWRRQSRSKACLGPLARSLSAPPVLRSPEPHFSLFNISDDYPVPSQPSSGLELNLNLALTLAPLAPPAPSAPKGSTPNLNHSPPQALPLQQVQMSQAGTGVTAAVAGSQAGAQGHQCFCLPAVSLPLNVRSDGWVRLFMLDWHYLVEVGEIECLSLDLEQSPDQGCDKLPCSNASCGRVETRENEFRCCSACTEVRYCSRVCQAQDWKMGHKSICARLVELQLLQQDAE